MEQRQDLWQCLLHLQDIWIDIAEVTVTDQDAQGRRKRRPRTLQSRAWVMTDRIGQRRLDGTMDVEAILAAPGEAFGRFLLGPGRQLALLSSQALAYDPLRQKFEKRLARYLSWQWRVSAHSGDFLRTYRVSTLLEELGLEVYRRLPQRTRDRLEQALDCLATDKLVSGWQYADDWNEGRLARQGWVSRWLEARIVVEAPDVIKNAYRRLDRLGNSDRKQPTVAVATGWGERVRERRQSLGLSQMEAAELIGTSRTYVAQIERGRQPSAALETLLKRWLGSES